MWYFTVHLCFIFAQMVRISNLLYLWFILTLLMLLFVLIRYSWCCRILSSECKNLKVLLCSLRSFFDVYIPLMLGLFCSFLIAESFRSFFNLLPCFVQCFLLLILDCSMLGLFKSTHGHQCFGYMKQGMVARSRYMFFLKNARGQLGALETSEKSFCTYLIVICTVRTYISLI